MALRAFISVDLPAMPAVVALAADLREASESLKVVDAEHLHLTLKFLGDTEEGLVPEIMRAIAAACEGTNAFAVRAKGTGAFPSLSHMNVLWVGIEGAEPLARIAGRLDGGLQAFGFPPETRPWTAHVTLARVRGGRGLDAARKVLQDHSTEAFAEVRVDEVRLKKSLLGPAGPKYTTVGAVRLEG